MRLHRSAIEAAKAVARIPDPALAARRRFPDFEARARRKLVEDVRGAKVPIVAVIATWTNARDEGEILRYDLRIDSSPEEVARVLDHVARAAIFNSYMEPSR